MYTAYRNMFKEPGFFRKKAVPEAPLIPLRMRREGGRGPPARGPTGSRGTPQWQLLNTRHDRVIQKTQNV